VYVNFENVPGFEILPNPSEFLRDALNASYPGILHLKQGSCFTMAPLRSQRILADIKYQIMSSCVFTFVAEILRILTSDLGSSDQTMKDFPAHVVWVVGLEEQITTCTSWFLVHCRGHSKLAQHWAQLGKFHLKDTESNFRNVVF
jgi:hypothetical protein